MTHYVYNDDIITCTADRDIAVNEFVRMGRLAGFAKSNVKAGDKYALVRRGVIETTVAATADVEPGQEIYFDGIALTTDATDATYVGFAAGDTYPASAGEATVQFILDVASAAAA